MERSGKMAYTPLYQRFLKNDVRFTTQYSHIYMARLMYLREKIKEEITMGGINALRQLKIVDKIIDLAPGDHGIVIGTIFKVQNAKPSVLDEFAKEFTATEQKEKVLTNYCGEEDYLVLEDESGRMSLVQVEKYQVDEMVTGIVVGVRGMLLQSGEFKVDAVTDQVADTEDMTGGEMCSPFLYPRLAMQPARKVVDFEGGPKYVLFISNVCLGAPSSNPVKLDMLLDYISGLNESANSAVKGSKDQGSVVRVVFCGNTLHNSVSTAGRNSQMKQEEADPLSNPTEAEEKQEASLVVEEVGFGSSGKLSSEKQTQLANNLTTLDNVLSQFVALGVPVDIMPGKEDLMTTQSLPQQPMSRVFFPNAFAAAINCLHATENEGTTSKQPNEQPLRLVTNPYEFQVNDALFLGSSGQAVESILKFINLRTFKCADEPSEDSAKNERKPPYLLKSSATEVHSTKQQKAEDYFEILAKQLFQWRHLCPTAPDSLPTYPLDSLKRDPFIIQDDHFPHIFFSGVNDLIQEIGKENLCFDPTKAGGERYERILEKEGRKAKLVLVPDFSATGEVICVDVNSNELRTELLSFEL